MFILYKIAKNARKVTKFISVNKLLCAKFAYFIKI